MKPCDTLLDQLEAAVTGGLSPELADHLATCSSCQLAVERVRGVEEGAALLRSVTAPPALKERLKALARIPQVCEIAIGQIILALDGDIDNKTRGALLDHLRSCDGCRAVWESLATLREVGAQTKPTPRLRSALAIHPTHRIATRQHAKRGFDLRLATAAVYLLAALTVTLFSDPANIAKASSSKIDEATTFALAAVENRAASLTDKAQQELSVAKGWVVKRAENTWGFVRGIFGGKNEAAKPSENPKSKNDVVKSGDGGRT